MESVGYFFLSNAFGPLSLFCPIYLILPTFLVLRWLYKKGPQQKPTERASFLIAKLKQHRVSIKRDFQFSLIHILFSRSILFFVEAWIFGMIFFYGLPLIKNLNPCHFHLEAPFAVEAFITTFVPTVFVDLSAYLMHRVFHTVPFLWSIHSVHHDAEFLTPLTSYRSHPLESIIWGSGRVATYALCLVFFNELFGHEPQRFLFQGYVISLFIYQIPGNLVHFPIAIRYPKKMCAIFISPHVHRGHHDPDPQFYNTNYGFLFSIWDRMFKTYREPAGPNLNPFDIVGEIGVANAEEKSLSSPPKIADSLVRPFNYVASRARAEKKGRKNAA